LNSLAEHLPGIHEARMAKYHSAIITTDGRLFVHGFGSGGRLGLGSDVNGSVLRPTRVTFANDATAHVVAVALGNTHTLVVLSSGTLMSFGSNESGQLGYATPVLPGSGEMGPEWTPKEVMKRGVVGVAAGKEHSVCWTEGGAVYTWGKNGGMLGTFATIESGVVKLFLIVFSLVLGHSNLAPNSLSSPRKVTSFHSPHIIQVECTASATAILHAPTPQDRAVVVFSAYESARVLFPVAPAFPRGFGSYTSSTQLEQQRRHKNTRLHRIVRLSAGNGQFAALTSAGEVFLWTPAGEQADPWLHSTFPQSKPKRIWAVRNRSWLAARDVAIGIDSAILVATRSGHVYRGTRREKAKTRVLANGNSAKNAAADADTDVVYFKFGMVPNLQHVTRVAASGSGGFAALRVDERPGGTHAEDSGHLRSELGSLVGDPEGERADVVFVVQGASGTTEEIAAHRAILAARSSFLKTLFAEADGIAVGGNVQAEGGIEVIRLRDEDDGSEDSEGPVLRIVIEGCHAQSLIPLLQFAYSAGFTKTWDHTVFAHSSGEGRGKAGKGQPAASAKKGQPTPAMIYADFRRLVKLFGIGDPDAIQFAQEQARVSLEFGKAMMGLVDLSAVPSKASVYPDAVLRLEDREVEVHRVFLVARSPFFHAMLSGGGSRWAQQTDDKGRIVVSMDHHRWEVIRVVLRWMYGDLDAGSLFSDIDKPTVQAFSDFVVEVLSVATELLLPQLKDICCSILVRTLDLRNVNGLLEMADTYDAEGLKGSCLDFVCWNLETCIESRMLEGLGPELIDDVSERLHTMQVEKYPFIRGEGGYYAQIRREAARVEEERKQRRRIDFGERRKLEELSRSLDDNTIGLLIANGAFDSQRSADNREDSDSSDDEGSGVPPIKLRGGMKRSISGGSGGGRDDDNIFDLEIDEGLPLTATARAQSWGKSGVGAAAMPPPSPRPSPLTARSDEGTLSGSPGQGRPLTPSAKRIAKSSWKKVDLSTGKVIEDSGEAPPVSAPSTPTASPAAPKTWGVPVKEQM
jgi:alpha-tubulin suppressor-like RCC1 family protein